MDIFKMLEEADYENLIFSQDKSSGLKAITCIHSTFLGPAIGGCRVWNYKNEQEAIIDVLRLAKGMTYKNSACGIYAGGAKTVVMVDPDKNTKSEAMFRAIGKFVEGMNGRYFIAEDVGTNVEDMDYIYQETDYVLGSGLKPGTSGNPSPSTARGVYRGIKASLNEVYGDDSLKDKTILLEGLGNVGLRAAKLAMDEGARVIGSDINQKAIEKAKEMGIEIVDGDKLIDIEADIYCPCALGAVLNENTIPRLKVKIVAGSANNQLAKPSDGDLLKQRGILYAPDFIINSGGVIQCHDELYGGYNEERSLKMVDNIYNQLLKVYKIAKDEDITTAQAADRLAERRIESVKATKGIFNIKTKSTASR